jgi:transposase, IS30 family
MEKQYIHLKLEERDEIYRLLADGRSRRYIAKYLGRAPSSISREINRNINKQHQAYFPDAAHSLGSKRRSKRQSKIERSKLEQKIEDYLAMELSPENIAGRLELELGKQIISHESIYKWIYGAGKCKNLHHYLPRKKQKRGLKPCQKANRSRIPGRISIHKRPENYSKQFGHWEGDTIHLAGNKGAILTLYEKTTKLTLGAKMHTRTSEETIGYLKAILSQLPQKARLSITFDNGSEFFDHQQLNKELNIETFFCDAYASWQKGGVENANGILRRRVPKGTRAEDCSADDVQRYLNRINSTPRKSLGYKTPYESFLQNLTNQTKIVNFMNLDVALQN